MPLVPRTQSLAAKSPPRVTLLLASRHCNLVSYFVPLSQKGQRRRHVEASYWTATSDVASTSAPVNCWLTAVNHRSTTSGPPIDGGQWRWSTAVNGGGPLVNHNRTTAGPPPDHRQTTTRPPLDRRRTTGQRWWLTGSWARIMNQEQIQQAARDEALVPSANRIKISFTNMRIDPTLTQKEETYQVILNIIKNSTCYNAFLVTTDVPEIYMQQFWFTIKKIKNTIFYKFNPQKRSFKLMLSCFARFSVFAQEFEEKNSLIGEEFQEYGRTIPDTMLTEEIKQSEAYKAFIGYSTGLVPLKKTRSKRSKGKKQAVTPNKKSSITTDDNIIPEPDIAFEFRKSSSRTEAAITDEARRVHETHEHLVTKILQVKKTLINQRVNLLIGQLEEEEHLVVLLEILHGYQIRNH
ncbi:hypothetical protein Tco_0658027 [Tanacetum coccineum]